MKRTMMDEIREIKNLTMAESSGTGQGKDIKDTEDLGFYFYFDEIDLAGAQEFIQWILLENQKKKHALLTLVVNSPGGDLNAGVSMIDAIKGSVVPVRTIGVGLVASAGLMVFMAGVKGDRILTPNTSILSHQFFWGTYGKEHELFAAQKEFDLTSKRIITHYKKCTTLNEKQIKKILLPAHDVWMEASEAQSNGLCDQVRELY